MGQSHLQLGPDEENEVRWWVERFRSALRLYDVMRIDHFRGFEATGRFRRRRPRPSTVSG